MRRSDIGEGPGVQALFEAKDEQVRETYRRLIETVQAFGPCREEAKKTSIHLVGWLKEAYELG